MKFSNNVYTLKILDENFYGRKPFFSRKLSLKSFECILRIFTSISIKKRNVETQL